MTGKAVKRATIGFLLLFIIGAFAIAADYTCRGNRIEKGSSTWGYFQNANGGYRIEKGSSTIGFVIKRGSKWYIESSGGSTLGYLNGTRIEKSSGSTWASLSEAKRFCDGPDAIAAAMWVLKQSGKL